MATLSTVYPTLVDVARIMDPNGSVGTVAEILQQYNDILDDIPWMEGNLPTGHQSNYRTSKPTPTLRLLNGGVVPTKSTTGQIVDACAILENRNHIDVDVASLNGNTAAFRLSQDKPMIQGFMDELSRIMIYGDSSVEPKEFNGLATRFYTLNTAVSSYTQLIDGQGTGTDNTSIWLVCWGPGKVYGIYPKGSKAGLVHEDRGIQDILENTSTGAYMRAYVSWMQWKAGIVVEDYRHVVRICNIDISNLETAGDSTDNSANITKYMSMALDLLPPGGDYRPVFYMNRRASSMLRVKLENKTNAALSVENVVGPGGFGRRQFSYYGVPIRRIDSLTVAESRITTSS